MCPHIACLRGALAACALTACRSSPLDVVYAAAVADAGAGFDNQRFELRARDTFASELRSDCM
jgi:hypothetical protein